MISKLDSRSWSVSSEKYSKIVDYLVYGCPVTVTKVFSLGNLRGYMHTERFCGYKSYELYVVDAHDEGNTPKRMRTVMTVSFHSIYKNVATVGVTEMHKAYRGADVAPKVYAKFVKATGFMLVAGKSQTGGGRSIWNRMAGLRGLTVMAVVNTRKGPVYHDVEPGDAGEVICESINVYKDQRVKGRNGSLKLVAFAR